VKKPGRSPPRPSPVDEAVQRARMALEARRPAEAEQMLRVALGHDARHAGALQLLGIALLTQGRAHEAAVPLEQAVREHADPVGETYLGIAQRQSGRVDAALDRLQRAAERQPPFGLAFHELGVLLFSQRRLAEAEAVLRRGLTVAPAMAELSIMLGGIHLDRGEREDAKLAFARALANAPGHPGAVFGMGTACMDNGEFTRAAERFRQILARDPGYAMARINLGNCLIELGQWDEGVDCLRTAVRAAPALYGKALRIVVSAGRGRFWLKPSAAAEFLGLSPRP
jgi:tetratricopeptide (TPR) repeat protein